MILIHLSSYWNKSTSLLLDLCQVFQPVPTIMWSFQTLEGLKEVSFFIIQTKLCWEKIVQFSSSTILHTNSTKVNSTLLPFRLDDSTDTINNCEWLLLTGNKVKRIEEPLQKERENAHRHAFELVSVLCFRNNSRDSTRVVSICTLNLLSHSKNFHFGQWMHTTNKRNPPPTSTMNLPSPSPSQLTHTHIHIHTLFNLQHYCSTQTMQLVINITPHH